MNLGEKGNHIFSKKFHMNCADYGSKMCDNDPVCIFHSLVIHLNSYVRATFLP